MPDLLLPSASKTYALKAASDGVVSYGVSSSHGATREQWFDETFSALSRQTGITFVKAQYADADLKFDVEDISAEEWLTIDGGEPALVVDSGGGRFLWKSSKDTRQYGGVQDQLTVSRAVLRSLGLSYPDGSPWNSDVQTTLLSDINDDISLYGHTFWPQVNDLNALYELYGRKSITSDSPVEHNVNSDEELVVALDGRVDYIYLSVKGVEANDQSSITYDEIGPVYNNYKNASIAGFNPWEGDIIFVERGLMSPHDGNESKTSEWLSSQEPTKSLSLLYSGEPESEHLLRLSSSEVIYNDAGKVMLNVNGTEPDLGPLFTTNNYLIAFLDFKGDVLKELPYGSIKTFDSEDAENTYARDLVGDVLTGSSQFDHNSFDAKFYDLGEGRYGVQKKGESSIDEITGVTSLQFQDQALSLAEDVAATFNQVKGIDDVSGVVFRLYNAAFARLPDANGLENWINGNSSGGMTYATSAQEFSSSQEFKNRYGANTTDTQYITTLYNNVLERSPDAVGLANYQNLLANGKTRGALLLDFSESPENRGLFTEVTGLS